MLETMPPRESKHGENSIKMWNEIAAQISQATGTHFEIGDRQSIDGGCINQAYLVSNEQERYFVKLNRSSLIDMFAAEASGLSAIATTNTIKVPLPICWGIAEDCSYLVLEHLDFTLNPQRENWGEMGRKLAAMHRFQISPDRQFGWHTNNTIGSTPQINTWERDWATFFTQHRIGYQLELAQHHGGNFPKAAQVLAKIPEFLDNYYPQPSLVHGDLWSGNASFTTAGTPVIFDPATYWGDREVDVAMAALFGGFPNAFYQGYADVYPLDPDYSTRKVLYDLYHILNHYNLFGGNYQGWANNLIETILRGN
jgi:fructosamine-3-kinase